MTQSPNTETPHNGCVLCAPLYLATGRINCWQCKRDTSVVAIIATRVDEYEDGVLAQGDGEEYVHSMDEDEMPEPPRLALEPVAPDYKPIFSGTMQETTWANGCENCGALQGAFYQHMEPDGPFFGDPSDFAGTKVVLTDKNIGIDYDAS